MQTFGEESYVSHLIYTHFYFLLVHNTKIAEGCAGLGQRFSKSYFSCLFCFEALVVAVGHETFDVAGLVAIEDAVDGVVAGYILNLTSAEIISFCEGFDVCLRQCRYHLMPDVHTSL